MIPVNSTPILEEIQQPQAEAMKEDTPAVVQEPQNEEAKPNGKCNQKALKQPWKLTK
jgi:hypothetical protein